jgi:hypothetical protein
MLGVGRRSLEREHELAVLAAAARDAAGGAPPTVPAKYRPGGAGITLSAKSFTGDGGWRVIRGVGSVGSGGGAA